MTQIVLTPDQVNLYRQARGPVEVCDAQGKVLGKLPPEFTSEYIAELKRRAAAPGPWYSGAEIQAMFRFLENAEANEGKIDEKRLDELLDTFEAQHGTST